MVETLTQELTFGRYISGIGTDGANVRRTIWISNNALALDFKNGTYAAAGVPAASLAAMPGYSYTRTGQVSFVNSSGTVTNFLANVPPILSGIGYEAYGALTNLMVRSQDFATSWAVNNTTVSTDTTVAPDGTTTADTLADGVANANHWVFNNYTNISTGAFTNSVFAKAGAGTGRYLQMVDDHGAASNFCNFDLVAGVVGSSSGLTGYIIPCANGWYRCVVVGSAAALNTQGFYLIMATAITDGRTPSYVGANNSVILWQAQTLVGTFIDGGPIIATAAAAASIGAQTLSLSVPSSTYSALYTFSDSTTQTISTVIGGGTFTMPAYPATLNSPAVASVVLT